MGKAFTSARKRFAANYPGTCDACKERFSVGDRIGYHEDYERTVCEPCLEELL